MLIGEILLLNELFLSILNSFFSSFWISIFIWPFEEICDPKKSSKLSILFGIRILSLYSSLFRFKEESDYKIRFRSSRDQLKVKSVVTNIGSSEFFYEKLAKMGKVKRVVARYDSSPVLFYQIKK